MIYKNSQKRQLGLAVRLGDLSELEADEITFVSKALGVQMNRLCGTRPKKWGMISLLGRDELTLRVEIIAKVIIGRYFHD